MKEVFRAPLSEEKITKDKKPEEEITLDWNDFQELWNARCPEDQLFEKKRNKLIEEKMLTKETPEVEVNLEWNKF